MQNEKIIRIRYLRILEQFTSAVIKAVKRSDFDSIKFISLVEKHFAIVENTKAAVLYDSYPKALENFVNLAFRVRAEENAQDVILKAANTLKKFKKAREYKRNKNLKDSDD